MYSQYDNTVRKLGISDTHRYLLDQIPDSSTILELGPSSGYVTKILQDKGCTIDAIELNPEDAKKAAVYCRKMVVGSIEDQENFRDLAGPYDVILAADVLEHLQSPEKTLKLMLKLVKPNGLVLVAMPNVAHWRVRLGLLFGRFDYTDTGILDRTHLRFYTLKTAKEMFYSAGCRVDKTAVIFFLGDNISVALKNLSRKILPTLFCTGFVYHLKPS